MEPKVLRESCKWMMATLTMSTRFESNFFFCDKYLRTGFVQARVLRVDRPDRADPADRFTRPSRANRLYKLDCCIDGKLCRVGRFDPVGPSEFFRSVRSVVSVGMAGRENWIPSVSPISRVGRRGGAYTSDFRTVQGSLE